MNQHDLVAQIIQQIFSAIPLGPLLGNLVGSPISNWLSPNSSMSNAIVWPGQGQTMGGATLNYINDIYTRGFASSGKAVSTEAETLALMAYHKMFTPGKTENEYRGMAENSMKNPFDIGGLLYQFTDPFKLTQGVSEAGNLASILTRRGSTFSIEGSLYANKVAEAIYGIEGKGGIIEDVIKNQKNYGNMTVAGVMTVGRELALTERDGFRNGDTFDSSRFKDRLQKVTKALEPWQDIFGKDIPKLLNQFEALTGTAIGSAGAADIERMGSRMSSILGATGARIQHIAAYRDTLAHGLADPTMSNRSILGAGALAGDLTLGLANLSLGYMTQQELQGITGVAYAGMAKSKYADRYALAYAKWAQDNGKGKAKFEDFDKAIAATGLSGHDALLAASGASNLTELEIYRSTDEFLSAHRTGAASRATGTASMGEVLQKFRDDYTSKNYAKFNDSVYKVISDMNDEELTEFLGMDKSKKQRFIQEHAGVDAHTALQIASDIGESATGVLNATGGYDYNVDQARSRFAERSNYNYQARQAQELENFSTAVRKLFRPGGLHGVIDAINKSGKDFHVSEHLQNYFGGSNMLAAMAESMSGMNKDDIDKNLPMLEQSMNFIRNNYANLSTDFSSVFDDLNGKDVWKGHKIAAALNAVDAKTLSEFKDKNGLIQTLEADIDSNDLGGVARNYVMDANIGLALDQHDTNGEGAAKKAKVKADLTELIKKDHWTYGALKKDIEEMYKGDKESLKYAKEIMSKSGVGDIDGNDPLHKIADFISELPAKLDAIITAIMETSNKGGSGGDRAPNSD